jgi:mannose-6-phosphate isomerase-like protein (cupin superfamily)
VVEGKADIIVGEEISTLEENQALNIPAGSFYRLGNSTGKDLRLIEVIKGR